VSARLGIAALAVDLGDVREAQSAMREALRLADPESLRRHFHEVGAGLRRLMREDQELAELYRSLGRRGHPTHPQAAQAAGGAPEVPVMVEKLSEREMDVLRYVEAMLPTEEIAGAMYLSVNTVKTHVRSILRKLAASRRNEAVRRARELGLI
jgi:LuxR family maltose regulon positive regulatory protein